MVKEISEGKHDMMFGCIKYDPGSMLIFELTVAVPEILDEGCELFFDLTTQPVLGQFADAFNLHGA